MSDQGTIVSDKQEYQWKITGIFTRNMAKATFVNVFLATPPSSVFLREGAMAGGTSVSNTKLFLISKYMESHFPSDAQGKGEILTGIFPHDASHAKPAIGRLSVGSATGMQVSLNANIKDISFVSKANSEVSHSGVTFKGKGMVARLLNNTATSFFFLREGTLFSSPDKATGFESESPISIHLRAHTGRIISPGTNVTFYSPQIKSVLIDGKEANVISQVAGKSVKVAVPKGSYPIKILSAGQNANATPKPPTQIKATAESEKKH